MMQNQMWTSMKIDIPVVPNDGTVAIKKVYHREQAWKWRQNIQKGVLMSMQSANVQTSLHKCTFLSEPSLFAHTIYS